MVIPLKLRYPRGAILELMSAGAILFVAYAAVVSAHFPNFLSNTLGTTAASLAFALAQLFLIALFGLHRRNPTASSVAVVGRFTLSLLLGAAICYTTFAALPDSALYRSSIPDALVLGGAGLAFVRWLLGLNLQGHAFDHRILILGTGAYAATAERILASARNTGITLVGFYPTENAEPRAVAPSRVLPESSSLEATVRRLGVHEVIVAIREQRGGTLPLVDLVDCRLSGVRVTPLSGFFEQMAGEVPIDSLKASWLIYAEGFRQNWLRRSIKRGFDIVAAAALLVVTAPVMLATAIAIYLESGGPIIFRQERVGLGGRPFMVLKFRSMYRDAEKDGVPQWACASDPRVTRVGRILRRCRVDELPQIINILRGQMSFVGPRPERPFFVSKLTQRIPFYGVRHSVKPGLTGWAQVSYKYGATDEDAVKKLQFDLYYVKNHTLALDLLVLALTVKVVLKGQGAH
jgi:sugar transferase (PEP-CTERM system associated)